jgi:hypothetical protein
MTEMDKLSMFENYMREKKMDEGKIKYNIKVVRLLINEVLYIFKQNIESIDIYSFEEFTDMVGVIDKEFGGRDGIANMLEAMQELTEFLKVNKLIKGGKIAYYKRMFSNTNYYIDKYDMMTGKKDDSRNFIKKILNNKLSSSVIKLIDDINIYDFPTISKIDKLLNDVPIGKMEDESEISLVRSMLIDINFMEKKKGQIETTKKGRAFSRLPVEDRYGALVHLLFNCVDWDNTLRINGIENANIDFLKFLNAVTSTFNKSLEVAFNFDAMKNIDEESMLVEISSERFRIARAESMTCGMQLMDICFIGMGIINLDHGKSNEIVYKVTPYGSGILKLLYGECAWHMKAQIEIIGSLIKNKRFDAAEAEVIDYLSVFGENIKIWNYLGQLLMLKKQYKYAYTVLKYAYENSTKRGKSAKSILYYLVMCCRKLKLKEDIKNYEMKLQTIDKSQ